VVVQLKLVKGFKFEEKPFHCFGGGERDNGVGEMTMML